MFKIIGFAMILFSFWAVAFGCQSKPTNYVWNEVTSNAAYPQGYNYPVFVFENKMFALNNGGWISKDGKDWTKTDLPESGLNSAYQKFVQFNDAVYSLGAMQGNYLNFKLSTKISRTRDGKIWEILSEKSNLPERVFYGAVVFKDKIWLVGGFDGKRYYNDVWNSADGVNWTRVAEKTAWSPRNTAVIVFKNKLLLMGGGVIDGEKNSNPNSGNEFWTSEDGVNWTRTERNPERNAVERRLFSMINYGSSAQTATTAILAARFWFPKTARIGANYLRRGDRRGGTAVWVFDGKLFMTCGKFSHVENGEIKFVYSNDVWVMSRKTE